MTFGKSADVICFKVFEGNKTDIIVAMKVIYADNIGMHKTARLTTFVSEQIDHALVGCERWCQDFQRD